MSDRVKALRQLIAALVLLAWLSASAHVALEHGGEWSGWVAMDQTHGHHHGHESDDAPTDGTHHHHDLGEAMARQFAKISEKQLLAPRWVPVYERLLAELALLSNLRDAEESPALAGDSPPDERRTGWLFVAQTALPVRGPSLAV